MKNNSDTSVSSPVDKVQHTPRCQHGWIIDASGKTQCEACRDIGYYKSLFEQLSILTMAKEKSLNALIYEQQQCIAKLEQKNTLLSGVFSREEELQVKLDSLKAINAELLEALHTIRAQSIGYDWTFEQAFRFIQNLAGETILKAKATQ